MIDTKKLRQRILDLAIRGKLVPQDPNDEPASVLLDRIRVEKERLIAEGKIKRSKTKKAETDDKSHYQQPFEIPQSWEWVKLEEIIDEPLYGTSEKSSKQGEVPVLRMGNIRRDGTIDFTDLVYSSNPSDIQKYELLPGDLLFNRTNSSEWVGKTALFNSDSPAIYAGYLIRIRPICIDSQYLNLVLNSSYHREWCNSVKTDAVNQSNINAQKLCNHLIPIPPLQEQKRIVLQIGGFINHISNITEDTKNIVQSIEQAKSKILELAITGQLIPQNPDDEPASELLKRINPKAKIVTDNEHYPQLPDNWVICRLKDVCNYGKTQQLAVDEIGDNKWILELEDIAKDSGNIITRHRKMDRSVNGVRNRFSKGMVLYSKLRTYLNKVLVADADGFCSTEIVPIQTNAVVHQEYLCAVLRSPQFLSYTAQCGYGVKMPRLSTNDANKALIPVPPYQEQLRIAAAINRYYVTLDAIKDCL